MDRDSITARACRECERCAMLLNGMFCNEAGKYVEYPVQRKRCPMGKFPQAPKRYETKQMEIFT